MLTSEWRSLTAVEKQSRRAWVGLVWYARDGKQRRKAFRWRSRPLAVLAYLGQLWQLSKSQHPSILVHIGTKK